MTKYYIISGEASGDLHGSMLIKELKKMDTDAMFRCWGGDLMKKEGAEIVKHYKDLAFMGFTEVLMHLGTIIRNLNFCKRDLIQFKPDVLILIDYPGFNLRIAEFAHKKGIRVFYYISPQIWAWKQKRVFTIKKNVERMFVILPFEKKFYQNYSVDVSYHGHPLLDAIDNFHLNQHFKNEYNLDSKPIVSLLPGSRKQEIKRMLPIMLDAMKEFSSCQIIVAGAKSIGAEFYHEIIKDRSVKLIFDNTYNILMNSKAAAVTSGTATLETALLNIPLVVCYKGGRLSYLIAKRLIKVKFISLVNLVLEKLSVKELIQDSLTTEALKNEMEKLLFDEKYRMKIFHDFENLKNILGGPGASARVAKEIYSKLKDGI